MNIIKLIWNTVFSWIETVATYFLFLNVLYGFYFFYMNVFVLNLVSSGQWAFKFIYPKWQESETVSELQLYCLFCETLINKVFTRYLIANPRFYHCPFIKKRVYHCLLRLLFKGGFYCFFFNQFERFLFEGGFYSRAVSIQENTVDQHQ